MTDKVLPVAVDAMGGDKAPGEIVAGALRARDELGVDVVLVGRPEDLAERGGLDLIEAYEVIAMDDHPAPWNPLLRRSNHPECSPCRRPSSRSSRN